VAVIHPEVFALYAEHLNAGGIVVLNFIGSHLDPEQRGALEAVASTARRSLKVSGTFFTSLHD